MSQWGDGAMHGGMPAWQQAAMQELRWLLAVNRSQARAERYLRGIYESQARVLARSGSSGSDLASARERIAESIRREVVLQTRIESQAWGLGLRETALSAARAAARLREELAELEAAMARAPYEGELRRLREWEDRLAARAALLRSMRAPEAEIERLLQGRVAALWREAEILSVLGRPAQADRALAAAYRLADRHGNVRQAIQERIVEVIGERPRNALEVTPLAVARAERAGAAAGVSVREGLVGGDRRIVVEFRAPRDAGNAVADAIINEVMVRLADMLRSRR